MGKRICHVSSVHPYNDNRIFYKEIQSCLQQGHDVTFMALAEKDFSFNGIEIFALNPIKSRIKRFLKVSILQVYKRAIKEVKADIYHFHDPELMPVALLLKMRGKKVVFDVHENNPASILSKPYIKSEFKKKVLSKIMDITEKFFFNFFDEIVTARPDISERLKKFNPTTIFNYPILPNIEEVVYPDFKKEKFSVIYVGGITEIRGITYLIKAFEYLDAELWLLGPFENEAFHQECMKLPGWEKVRYLGVVEPYEIFSFVKYADAGIVTFLPYPNHLTTIATKPFEYMACGLPIIMSDFPYWKNFFQETALYVDPAKVEEISAAISELMNNPTRKKEIGENNLKLSHDRYSWSAEFKKLEQVYFKLFN